MQLDCYIFAYGFTVIIDGGGAGCRSSNPEKYSLHFILR